MYSKMPTEFFFGSSDCLLREISAKLTEIKGVMFSSETIINVAKNICLRQTLRRVRSMGHLVKRQQMK